MQQSNSAGNQQVSEVDKAWLAGIIDGEGCITMHRNPRPKKQKIYFEPSIIIGNTCPILISKTAKIINDIGVGRYINKRKVFQRGNRRPALEIRVTGHYRVTKLLVAIMPYLVSKQEEALLVFTFCNDRIKDSNGGLYKDVPYTSKHYQIFDKLKEIKKLRHLREHTPDSMKTIEKMCSELHSDMQRIAEMTIPQQLGRKKLLM